MKPKFFYGIIILSQKNHSVLACLQAARHFKYHLLYLKYDLNRIEGLNLIFLNINKKKFKQIFAFWKLKKHLFQAQYLTFCILPGS